MVITTMVPPFFKIPTGWRLHVHNPHLHPRHEEGTSLAAVIKLVLVVVFSSEDRIDQISFQCFEVKRFQWQPDHLDNQTTFKSQPPSWQSTKTFSVAMGTSWPASTIRTMTGLNLIWRFVWPSAKKEDTDWNRWQQPQELDGRAEYCCRARWRRSSSGWD